MIKKVIKFIIDKYNRIGSDFLNEVLESKPKKKESFMQGVLSLMVAQVLIKLLGLVYKWGNGILKPTRIYVTNQTIIDVFVRRDGEGCCFFTVEGTQAKEVTAPAGQSHILTDHIFDGISCG